MTNQTANMIALATIKGDTPDEARITLTYDVEAKMLYAEGPGLPTEEVGPRFETISDAEDYILLSYGRDGAGVWGLEWIEREQ
jgi:hypothetical protein